MPVPKDIKAAARAKWEQTFKKMHSQGKSYPLASHIASKSVKGK